jgi:hypothetical protein
VAPEVQAAFCTAYTGQLYGKVISSSVSLQGLEQGPRWVQDWQVVLLLLTPLSFKAVVWFILFPLHIKILIYDYHLINKKYIITREICQYFIGLLL